VADLLSMKISRHYITINNSQGSRRVHYRVCGSGPALLMIHQSPRSGAEYERLMLEWGKEFTCIAPDSPGYGNSGPLNHPDPKLADFADGVAEFMDAIGLKQAGGYGFHSGGAIAMNLHVRYPGRLSMLVSGGYPIWSDEEKAMFASSYLPRFLPQVYGDHLTWLWGRMLEQSWFFPWFDRRHTSRMTVAHQDPTKAAPGIAEVLDAGDNYRFGYNAVLQADSDIPPADTKCAPAHISTYKADPLAKQLDRLPQLPEGWSFALAENPLEFEAWAIGKLRENVAPAPGALERPSGCNNAGIAWAWSCDGAASCRRFIKNRPARPRSLKRYRCWCITCRVGGDHFASRRFFLETHLCFRRRHIGTLSARTFCDGEV